MGQIVKGATEQEKTAYRIRFEKALILILGIMILVFLFSQRIPQRRPKEWGVGRGSLISVDVTPATSFGSLPRPPSLPQVPIPTEDEYLPEDETIEDTRLDLTQGIPLFDGSGMGGGGSGEGGLGPRPIREVIPEYTKEERKRGVEGLVELEILVNARGEVDSVRVLQNTTRSKRLEEASVQAAYQSRYLPARRDGKSVPQRIRRSYRFEKSDHRK